MAKTLPLLVLGSLCCFLCSCGEKSTTQAAGSEEVKQGETKADEKNDGQSAAGGSNATPGSGSAKPAAPA